MLCQDRFFDFCPSFSLTVLHSDLSGFSSSNTCSRILFFQDTAIFWLFAFLCVPFRSLPTLGSQIIRKDGQSLSTSPQVTFFLFRFDKSRSFFWPIRWSFFSSFLIGCILILAIQQHIQLFTLVCLVYPSFNLSHLSLGTWFQFYAFQLSIYSFQSHTFFVLWSDLS